MSCRFARACSVSPARYSCETCCLNSTLWVRCFALGLHPLKARLPGQLLKTTLSGPRGPLHTQVNLGRLFTLRFLETFKSSYYADVTLNQWLALTSPELVKTHLKL